MYKLFFESYTQKFTLTHPSKLHCSWAKQSMDRAVIDQRVKMNSLMDVIRTTMMSKPVKTRFLYPQGGIGVFSEKLARRIQENGGIIETGTEVERIETTEDRIKSVVYAGKTYEPDYVYWSAPISRLAELLHLEKPGISYLSTICYNIEVKGPVKSGYRGVITATKAWYSLEHHNPHVSTVNWLLRVVQVYVLR